MLLCAYNLSAEEAETVGYLSSLASSKSQATERCFNKKD